ncbi:MAG: rhodanese-like domain-containing protein [Clostridium sp.]|nr:rhodanese-like domain-containing protein [Clostridium sp.]
MGLIAKKLTILSFLAVLAALVTGCSSHTFTQGESLILPAEDLASYAGQEKVVIVDTRTADEYAAGHVAGAVNIPTEEIVINVPVKNMLTSKKKMEKVMGSSGIGNDTLVLAYDANKMGASRLLWSLFMYGHQNVKVVDGGFDAIQTAGLEMTTDVPAPEPAVFTAGEPGRNWLASMEEVREQAEQPDSGVVLLDVRSMEEFAEAGKVPGSVIIPYETNFFSDGTFKTTQITRINYLEEEIYPEDEIILYCQTSMRAAPVFVQLYEAGYRNIRLYDGAYLEWSSNSDNPVEMPAGGAAPVKKNAS